MKKGAMLIALLMLAAAAPARADEGRIPIWQPVVITAPGSYVVTQDITAANGPILDVRVGGVHVDLNGHTITVSNMADPLVAIASVMGIEPEPFHIENGSMMGGSDGLSAGAAITPCVKVFNVTFGGQANAAISIGALADLEAKGIIIVGSRKGFALTGQQPAPNGQHPTALISDSIIRADVGVSCDGVACKARNNAITSCGSAVKLVAAQGSEVVGNILTVPGGNVCFNPQPEPPGDTIHVGGSPGVHVEGNTLRGWMAASTGGNHGITADAMSPGVFITDNVVSGFGDDALHIAASQGLVRGNLLQGNGGNGIVLTGMGLLVDDNRVTGNARNGIVFDARDNIYRANVLLGNGTAVSGMALADTVDGGGNIQ